VKGVACAPLLLEKKKTPPEIESYTKKEKKERPGMKSTKTESQTKRQDTAMTDIK
jgi:hypothetical protein